jgi:hypothetical protein
MKYFAIAAFFTLTACAGLDRPGPISPEQHAADMKAHNDYLESIYSVDQ